MKRILIVLTCLLMPVSACEPYAPVVVRFIQKCTADHVNDYREAEAWLKASKLPEDVKDQCREKLSGLVWNIDRKRAHAIAGEIKDPALRKETMEYFEFLENH